MPPAVGWLAHPPLDLFSNPYHRTAYRRILFSTETAFSFLWRFFMEPITVMMPKPSNKPHPYPTGAVLAAVAPSCMRAIAAPPRQPRAAPAMASFVAEFQGRGATHNTIFVHSHVVDKVSGWEISILSTTVCSLHPVTLQTPSLLPQQLRRPARRRRCAYQKTDQLPPPASCGSDSRLCGGLCA